MPIFPRVRRSWGFRGEWADAEMPVSHAAHECAASRSVTTDLPVVDFVPPVCYYRGRSGGVACATVFIVPSVAGAGLVAVPIAVTSLIELEASPAL